MIQPCTDLSYLAFRLLYVVRKGSTFRKDHFQDIMVRESKVSAECSVEPFLLSLLSVMMACPAQQDCTCRSSYFSKFRVGAVDVRAGAGMGATNTTSNPIVPFTRYRTQYIVPIVDHRSHFTQRERGVNTPDAFTMDALAKQAVLE